MTSRFAVRVAETDPFSHDSTAAAVRHLSALVEAQARTIRDYEARLARSREIFERASSAARLGIWECDLSSEKLQWSDGTYDMFDIPRGAPLVRKQTLQCYPSHSLKMLETIRSRAIARRESFNLDAEILTGSGNRRWIRITAMVECAGDRPIRLFGIKQDITDAKARLDRAMYLAEFDDLTGLANRSQFERRLARSCEEESGGFLLLIDLDGFKEVNDSSGHAAGDACLQEAARRLRRVCGSASLARIGGDEFAVLLDTRFRIEATELARRIVAAMAAPIELRRHRFRIGASIGIARTNGCSAGEAFRRADAALYAAKGGGRGTFRLFVSGRMQA
jgi:diguanylate cyclase (GGDEF)-like protein